MTLSPFYFSWKKKKNFKKENTNLPRKQKTMRLGYPAWEYNNNNHSTFTKIVFNLSWQMGKCAWKDGSRPLNCMLIIRREEKLIKCDDPLQKTKETIGHHLKFQACILPYIQLKSRIY